ncbi:MAG: metallophosphoesterase [Clostridiaceae bacterium]
MAIYAISDLHLALSVDKPMDVFGARWSNYMDRLEENWRSTVDTNDYVLIPGDISWATYLSQAYKDFSFIEQLPGIKIISKGNHDYWWTTKNKLDKFLSENGFSSIHFMHNNSFTIEDTAVCGTRGWEMPGEDGFNAEDAKIYSRELQRLELSLKSAVVPDNGRLIAAMHFPVFNSNGVFSEFLGIMEKYRVQLCIYGHLHGEAHKYAVEGTVRGVEFRLVAADRLGFRPLRLY